MKFSIILPVHNAAAYMGNALESIRRQSWKDYELIILCDACEDDSERIAREYAATWPWRAEDDPATWQPWPKVRVETVDYHCAGLTRNRGLELAQGEWVLFMDDDDWLLHEYVFAQLASMAGEHDEDILACGFIWKGVGVYTPKADDFNAAVWNKAWRRAFIGDTRFSDRRYGDDEDFTRAMLAKDPKICFWGMPIYYYNYLRQGSLTDKLQRVTL